MSDSYDPQRLRNTLVFADVRATLHGLCDNMRWCPNCAVCPELKRLQLKRPGHCSALMTQLLLQALAEAHSVTHAHYKILQCAWKQRFNVGVFQFGRVFCNASGGSALETSVSCIGQAHPKACFRPGCVGADQPGGGVARRASCCLHGSCSLLW